MSRERSRTLPELLARKRELIERAAAQRQALADDVPVLFPAFAAGDKVVEVGRRLLAHPVLLAAAGAVLLVLWRRPVLALATRGFALWSGARAARRALSALAR